MTSTDYWWTTPFKYKVVIHDDDVTNASEWLEDNGYHLWSEWNTMRVGGASVMFEFRDEDTATFFKLRWSYNNGNQV